ncbi:dihydrodipicolinate synthase family protein [Xanthobacter sp.]|uniref:dihydrodipicolinate synthase family protein n=1 Tax=Xanthobacter sp. TaxID=35809 RepID=UPI0025FB18DD|nr:dihydrodipicolinate synthase family protein [Xanthobacter sp.]
MTRSVDLSGVTVATILPFHDDFSIDWASYERVLAYCTRPTGIRAVFVNGHAGEGATLDDAERIEVIRRTRAFIGPDVPLLSGIIAWSTAEAVAQAQMAEAAGVDAAVLFPLPQFSGGAGTDPRYALDYVDSVLAATSLPLSIFQQPVASGYGFSSSILGELVARPRVIAVKEGSGDIGLYEDNLRRIKAVAPDCYMLPSNYHWLVAQVAIGADGILSGMASLIPDLLSDLWSAAEAGDLHTLRALNDQLYPIVRTIYGAPPLIEMHTRIKVALRHLGLISSAVPRRPLLPVPADVAARVGQAVDAAGLARLLSA